MKAEKKSHIDMILLILIIIVLIIVIGFIVFIRIGNKTTTATTQSSSSTSNWKTYTNTIYGFSIKYPDNFSTVENPANKTIANDTEIVNINSLPGGGQTPTTGNYAMMTIKFSSDLSKYPNIDQTLSQSQQMFAVDKSSTSKKIQSNSFEGVITTSSVPKGGSSDNSGTLEMGNLYKKISSGFYYITWSAGDSNNEGFNFAKYGDPMLSTFKLTK